MLANLPKSAIEIAIAAVIERNTITREFRSITVKWSKDRCGCYIATLRANFDNLPISVIVEEQDENEWTAYLDGTLPAMSFSVGNLHPRLETADEVNEMITLLRRGRDLLACVQTEIERAAEIARAAK